MKFSLLAVMVVGFAAVPAWAVDTVVRLGGGQTIGTLESTTPSEVGIVTPAKKLEKIPVNTIESIRYEGEHPTLNLLRSDVRNANFRAAFEKLDNLETLDVTNPRVKDEIVFYRAIVTARQALTSGSREQLAKGGKLLTDYLAQNPSSWHLYEAVETIGDLYVALAGLSADAEKKKVYEMADKEYEKLASAPWDDYKLRAAIARGRANQRAGETENAKRYYQDAIRLGGAKSSDASVAPLVLAARVGLADVLADSSPAEGIKIITEVVAGADPENTRLHALAFLTLGKCHDKAKNSKEALLNFLKVDVLYFGQADCHAESLYHLSRLWNDVNRPDRAKEAAEKLKSRYPNSLFASRLGQ
jgi:tetratricopeptide (TPR) repeat protein